MSEGNTLPDSWITIKVSDVGASITGNTPSTQHAGNYGTSIPYIKPPQLIDRPIDSSKEFLSEQGAKLARVLPPFSVLVSCIGNLGKTGINKIPVAFNQQINAIVPFKGISPTFLFYQAQSHSFRSQLESKATATTISIVNKGNFETVELNIAPLPEQHRIVAKIEELFSELDKGIENLKTARAQLKVYRQALLKHAFEGKLTAQWRAENQNKLETAAALQKRIQQESAQRYQQQLADWEATGKQGSKPKAPKPLPPLTAEELAELPELPEGWGWTRLLETCEAVVDCHNKTAPYQATGIPLVRTPSIRDMKLNFDDSIRYVSQETYEYWSRRCPPLPGDILFTREAPMGEAALIPEGKMVCMGQRIMLLRPGKFMSGKYLLSATQNPIFKRVANKVAVGTGVKHLRVGDVEKLVFPLCSVSEQTEISNQLEACLSEADQLDQTLTTALQQAEALRQSILKKAFAGLLVPQDPHDEPASKLLARIKAERATAKESLAVPLKGRTAGKSNMQKMHIASELSGNSGQLADTVR